MDFFVTSTTNLLKYGAEARVEHIVALSVVGTDRLLESAYFRAKSAQEGLLKEARLPYSIVRATQFFEFVKSIAETSMKNNKVHLAPVLIQPMVSDDVARGVAMTALEPPTNGTLEIAGPEQFRLDDLICRGLASIGDSREVVADPEALYFGAHVEERTLVPEDSATLGAVRFETWLTQGNLTKS